MKQSLSSYKLPDLCAKYLNWLVFVQSCSLETTRAYASDLEQAFELRKFGKLRSDPAANPPCSFTPDGPAAPILTLPLSPDPLLRTCRQALTRWSNLQPASRNRKAACLKSFLGWLFQEHFLEVDLATQILSPKVPIRLPHFISLDEAIALITTLRKPGAKEESDEAKFERASVLTLILLLYGGGLRVSEACGLRWSDIKDREKILRIAGKGGRERLVALPPTVFAALAKMPKTKTYVFGEEPLSTRKAYEWVRLAGIRTGLTKPLHPHALRHSFATHLLASGANLRTLQELLGHSSLTATQKYTHLGIDQLARTMERHHPLAGGKTKG